MRPTASSLERAEACPVSYALPQISKASEWAERGSAIHEFVRARLVNRPMVEALEHVPEELRDTCRGIDLHRLVGDLATVRSEVAYAIDVRERTARELGVNIHRKYEEAAIALGKPLGPYEIPGTIDVEGRTRLGVELAGDLKTGFRGVIPVVEHRQVHWEVTARALMAEAPAVEGRIFKVREGGEVEIDAHLFGGLELDETLDDLEEIHNGVIEARDAYQNHGEIRVMPGPWCDYCNANPVCPARTELARAVTINSGTVIAQLTKMTREQEWEAILQWKAGDKVLDAIGAIMKSRATQRNMMGDPITSPDGSKYFGPVNFQTSSFSKEHALALLRHLGADEDQIRGLFIPTPVEQWRILNVPGAKKPKLTAKRAKALEAEKAAAELAASAQPALLPEGRGIPRTDDDEERRGNVHNPGAAMREKANES
jgi:hypothetical protein